MDERCPNCGANLSRQLFIGFGSGFGGWHHGGWGLGWGWGHHGWGGHGGWGWGHHGWGGYGWHRSDEE